MFAQLSYKQFVGDSHLSIDEIGCFVDAFANLLEKVGVTVDPPTLNTFFTNNHVYTYDKTDRANDDLYWNSVTRFCPQLVVAQIGGAGFPNADLAIVEFHYRSVQHPTLPDGQPNMIIHFCAVNSAADHSIIDSWDGRVKTPAEYEHVYGQPVAYATYTFHTAQTIPASLPPAAPVSAPKAAAPAPQPPAPATPTALIMPKTDHFYLWHVYHEGGPWTLPYAIGALDPFHYGPLTYPILGNPAPHIYIIQTESFGRVAVYAGPDTVAQFQGGHGEGESTDSPAPDAGIPVSEVVPAPSAPTTSSIIYARFDQPMQLVTNKDTHSVNFVSGATVTFMPQGTPFEAVGKATLPNSDNDTYYMNDNDFGIADQIQRTPITVGVKTLDLKPAPVNTVNTIAIHTPLQSSSTASSSIPLTASSTATDTPAAPEYDLPWQRTMKFFMNPIVYVARRNTKLFDFPSGNAVKEVTEKGSGEIVGKFEFAGSSYWRTKASLAEGTWQGFPVADLERGKATNMPFNTNDDINKLDYELTERIGKAKHAAIKAGASADGFFARLKGKKSI